jgi:hypothetical protein
MEKYLIIYGHKDNTTHTKNLTWRETKEEAERFTPFNPDYMVFQIIYVPEGKGY